MTTAIALVLLSNPARLHTAAKRLLCLRQALYNVCEKKSLTDNDRRSRVDDEHSL